MNKYLGYIARLFRFSDNTSRQESNSGADGIFKMDKQKQNRNITSKILAIVIAIGLWIYVMNEQNPPIEARYIVPLEIRNVQANYIVAEYPGDIRVRVRGPRILIAATTHKDISAFVDMTNLSEGRHNIGVRALIPPTLELVENTPETVVVRLEPIIVRPMPIMVEFRGVLPDNVSISRVNSKLAEATVKGPKHIVDTVDRLMGVIDVTGKSTSFSAEAPMIPLGRTGALIEGLTVSPPATTVEVDIEPNVVKKMLEVKPLFHGALPQGITLKSISFDPASIEVKDPTGSDLAEKIEHIYTEPINLPEIDNDIDKVVKITIPKGLTSVSQTVTAQIKVRK